MSSMPIEFVGKDGVIKRVSLGHMENEAPTMSRSRTIKFLTPASLSATATPTPAAPPPTTMTS